MRFLFSVIANRYGEQIVNPDEMASIDAFNDKIEAAGQRVIAVGIAGLDTAVLFDNRQDLGHISQRPAIDSDTYMAGFWIIETDDESTAHTLASEASKACNRIIEVRQIFH
jgi:hypothetical protein